MQAPLLVRGCLGLDSGACMWPSQHRGHRRGVGRAGVGMDAGAAGKPQPSGLAAGGQLGCWGARRAWGG